MDRMRTFALFLVVSMLVAAFPVDTGAEPTRGDARPLHVALLRADFPRWFTPDEKDALVKEFLCSLTKTGRFAIVARDEMDAILGELRFQATDLVDEDKVVDLGRLLGVEAFIICSIRPLKGTYQVTAESIRVETGKVDRIAVRHCDDRFDFLAQVLNEVAYDLAGVEEGKGRLVLESEPPEAEVWVFGVRRGTTPTTLRLAPGLYLVSIRRKGYLTRRKTLEVAAGEETSWKPVLARKRRSFRLGDYIGGASFWK